MIVTLEEARLHLRVTGNDEDALIEEYIGAAEEFITATINESIPGIAAAPPAVPKPLKAAALLFIGELYQHREIQVTGAIISENPTFNRLVQPYRKNMGI